ncbi:MAG: Na+/H+ antiporter subunit E [Rickettsiales bacterium]|nr:Na+/H+ antiporter subunit E [Rickettsiales bacterium]
MIKLFALILFVVVMGGSHQLVSVLIATVIAVASITLSHFLCKNERYNKIGIKINHKFFIYLMQLLKEIFFSTISVCKAIFFRKRSDLRPVTTKITTKQKTDEAKVLFGNSITLTPGTITIDITQNTVMIHAIDAECIDGCRDLDSKIIKSQS